MVVCAPICAALLPLTASFVPPLPLRHACSTPLFKPVYLRCSEPREVAVLLDQTMGVPQDKPIARKKLIMRFWGFSSSGEQLGPHIVLDGKVLNWFGALYMAQALFWAVFWAAGMSLSRLLSCVTSWDPKRKFYDAMGSTPPGVGDAGRGGVTDRASSRLRRAVVVCEHEGLSSRIRAHLGRAQVHSPEEMDRLPPPPQVGGCGPATVTGLEHVPSEGQPVVFAANHASWFDIPLVAQCIPSTFKFIASEVCSDRHTRTVGIGRARSQRTCRVARTLLAGHFAPPRAPLRPACEAQRCKGMPDVAAPLLLNGQRSRAPLWCNSHSRSCH